LRWRGDDDTARICMTNNAAERSVRGIAVGRDFLDDFDGQCMQDVDGRDLDLGVNAGASEQQHQDTGIRSPRTLPSRMPVRCTE